MSHRFEEPWPLRRLVGHPVFWGVLATIAVLAAVIWAGTLEDCGLTGGITGSCASKAEQFRAAKPQEIVTVIGGLALVLIWVWLVVLAWVQSRVASAMRLARPEEDAR